jgi:hypothetical protein
LDDSKEEIKDQFYEQLEQAYSMLLRVGLTPKKICCLPSRISDHPGYAHSATLGGIILATILAANFADEETVDAAPAPVDLDTTTKT